MSLAARCQRGVGLLSQPKKRPQLRLIESGVVECGDAVAHLDEVNLLRAEARDFEARNGKNPYSDFILKYGRRPDPKHAAVLGRLINKRIKASDGTLQPRLTLSDRERRKSQRVRQKIDIALSEQITLLTTAICNLSEITASSSELINRLGPVFDKPIIREKLEAAIDSLQRFADEWRHVEKGQIQRTPR
jgi:hypothetical protein